MLWSPVLLYSFHTLILRVIKLEQTVYSISGIFILDKVNTISRDNIVVVVIVERKAERHSSPFILRYGLREEHAFTLMHILSSRPVTHSFIQSTFIHSECHMWVEINEFRHSCEHCAWRYSNTVSWEKKRKKNTWLDYLDQIKCSKNVF